MDNYKDLLREVIITGTDSVDRTGVGTVSIWGAMLKFNLQEGFPATTCKGLAWKAFLFVRRARIMDQIMQCHNGLTGIGVSVRDIRMEAQGFPGRNGVPLIPQPQL
ncbi:thymidylate synthase [Shigella sonnei]|uniref:Thymidylate synthase-like protein n=2 Tax=Enterobacteriaceae TaxID=543 RepID=Q5D6W4_ECOLX|nr:Orf105 [Citrobacter freundii]AAX18271.1 thymidylate synthase-like protein [Escherichia coli]CSO38637.1 thymidylate synthase [Shigella sonnei]AAX18282.1 thymidylate synthase-like protein [Escherichia coli]ACO24932.1 thymidylate synthase-like protein [Escherichia coli]